MSNELSSCTDQSEKLLDQKCYMFVSNFTGFAYGLKIMTRWAKDNDVDINSTYRSSDFLSTKIDGGMLSSF